MEFEISSRITIPKKQFLTENSYIKVSFGLRYLMIRTFNVLSEFIEQIKNSNFLEKVGQFKIVLK
jgi:hypothetical protein